MTKVAAGIRSIVAEFKQEVRKRESYQRLPPGNVLKKELFPRLKEMGLTVGPILHSEPELFGLQ